MTSNIILIQTVTLQIYRMCSKMTDNANVSEVSNYSFLLVVMDDFIIVFVVFWHFRHHTKLSVKKTCLRTFTQIIDWQVDRQTNRRNTDIKTVGWDRQTYKHETDRYVDRQQDKQTDTQTDRQARMHAYKNILTDKQTGSLIDRKTIRGTCRTDGRTNKQTE